MHLTYQSAAESLPDLAKMLAQAPTVRPRGMETRELTDVTIVIEQPFDCLLYDVNRAHYHPTIGAIEGLQMIAGVSDPGMLTSASRAFESFMDGRVLHGSYGPRLRPQLPDVLRRLAADLDTRQAVATIWDPMYDLRGAMPGEVPRDLPCTISLTFRVRDGRLTMKTHMRSNDLWRGWCYDVVQFTLLQCTMANLMGIPVGPYVHHADSLHLYREHYEAAADVTWRPAGANVIRLFGLGAIIPNTSWEDVRARALDLLYDPTYVPESTTEAWLRDRVRSLTRNERTNEEG